VLSGQHQVWFPGPGRTPRRSASQTMNLSCLRAVGRGGTRVFCCASLFYLFFFFFFSFSSLDPTGYFQLVK